MFKNTPVYTLGNYLILLILLWLDILRRIQSYILWKMAQMPFQIKCTPEQICWMLLKHVYKRFLYPSFVMFLLFHHAIFSLTPMATPLSSRKTWFAEGWHLGKIRALILTPLHMFGDESECQLHPRPPRPTLVMVLWLRLNPHSHAAEPQVSLPNIYDLDVLTWNMPFFEADHRTCMRANI